MALGCSPGVDPRDPQPPPASQGVDDSAAAKTQADATSRPRVLFLGDSLSAGYGLREDQAFPALIQEKIDEMGWPFEVVNAGVSGDTTAGGLSRIEWLLKRPPAVLVLELGGNDGLRGIAPEVTESNLQSIVDKVLDANPGARIVIAGMLIPPNLGPDYFRAFQSIFPRLAQRNEAVLIPFLLEGVAGKPELNLPDGIHPTAEGHRIVAEHTWSFIKPVLEDLDRSSR